MENLKIKLENISKKELIERKKIIEELLEEDFSETAFNQENLLKVKDIAKKYKKVTSDDWKNKPIKIIIANSDGTELATVTNY